MQITECDKNTCRVKTMWELKQLNSSNDWMALQTETVAKDRRPQTVSELNLVKHFREEFGKLRFN